MLHVSATQLKVTFKSVSGSSIYAYQRKQKMLAAADDLCKTDDSVLKIAGKYGYENGSKFAKAFRDTFGMSPSMYRKTNRVPA
jgi:AraC-like DNA-binding protein